MKDDSRRTPIAAGIILLAVFLIMLYCNFHTGMLVDDYVYCFDFSTGWEHPEARGIFAPLDSVRIEHVSQIFSSMAMHRRCNSGRVLSHFLVQLFLMMPKSVFNICNSAMFVLQIFLIHSCSQVFIKKGSKSGILLSICFSFMGIWIFEPAFGEINIWLDGSFNYLWMSTLFLYYLYLYARLFKFGEFSRSRFSNIIAVVFGVFAGMSHEVTGMSLIMISFVVLVYIRRKKGIRNIWGYLSLATITAGFLFLVLAPKEMHTQVITSSISDLALDLFYNLVFLTQYAVKPMILFILAMVLLAVASRSGVDKDVTNFVLLLLFVTTVSFVPLIMGTYVVARCLFLTTILLVVICLILMRALLINADKVKVRCIYAVFAVLMVLTPFFVARGLRDITLSYKFTTENEAYIADCIARGEGDILLPDIERDGLTWYTPLKDLKYVDHYDNTVWPNAYIAKYYEVDSVTYSGVSVSPDSVG